ncbi:MAG: sporulation protein [Gammaproteobacteria bacterium]|nr:sporulation protein [Gammaproteobacteria bacterium]
MAVRKGKSQARRNSGNSGGLPGWAWMVLGIVITLVVVLAAPRLLRSDGDEGFYRPRPNPDATPAPATGTADEDAPLPAPVAPAESTDPDYDFYTLLPGQEVPMTDAELEASAKAEQAREQRQAQQREQDAARLAEPDAQLPAPTPEAAAAPAAAQASTDTSARYLLQAGSFSASGDAEALKARIALLGLGARVESAQVDGRTVYRVRMGPYGTASELADAKGKLERGGLDPLAIKVQ